MPRDLLKTVRRTTTPQTYTNANIYGTVSVLVQHGTPATRYNTLLLDYIHLSAAASLHADS